MLDILVIIPVSELKNKELLTEEKKIKEDLSSFKNNLNRWFEDARNQNFSYQMLPPNVEIIKEKYEDKLIESGYIVEYKPVCPCFGTVNVIIKVKGNSNTEESIKNVVKPVKEVRPINTSSSLLVDRVHILELKIDLLNKKLLDTDVEILAPENRLSGMLSIEECNNICNRIKTLDIEEEFNPNTLTNVCKPGSPVACIMELIQKYKDDKVYTSDFHKLVKEKYNLSPQQIKVIISGMGYDSKQRNGKRSYYF